MQRMATESFFTSFDGTELFYRTWAPSETSDKAIILIHRGHEHSGRIQTLVDGLDLSHFWAFAYDGRGHGKSPGPRGYAKDFSYMVKDLDVFVRMISEKHQIPIENISVVANSVGAVVASTWLHDYAPRIRSIVMAAPAFKVKLYVPFALPGLRLLDMIKHPAFISSYVKSKMLTHDREESKKYDEDPLITRDIAVNILIGLFDNAKRVIADAAAITTPTLILSAGKDFVVHTKQQVQFFQKLGSPIKKMHIFRNFFHGVLYEKGKEEAFKMAREFIVESYKQQVDRTNLITADQSSYTLEEYETLKAQPNIFKKIFFGMQRYMLSSLGQLSKGVKIGWKTGFDSGLSLDHVYKNKAEGQFFIGKIIDYFYINAIGWKGIRIRKVNLEKQIQAAIDLYTKQKPHQTVHVLDIAGGAGRYMIELAARNKNIQFHVRDNTQANLLEGQTLAKSLGLTNIDFELKDAFDQNSYTNLNFKPDIAIVSGLFELFPSNQFILKAIKGISSCIANDGYIVYTGQPWHPQIEMIARTLHNRDHQQWIMRRRTQAELDELFYSQGLQKKSMEIDPYGIFTVSLAQYHPTEKFSKISESNSRGLDIATQ